MSDPISEGPDDTVQPGEGQGQGSTEPPHGDPQANASPDADPRTDADEPLHRASVVMAEALARGRSHVDLEALCAEHGELATELRQLHAACRAIGHVLDDRHDSRPRGVPAGLRRSDPKSPPRKLLRRVAARTSPFTRYRVESELGRGGMGIVRKVWDDDLQRPLAMKLARRGLAREQDSLALGRFLEEAQITSQLDHPGIVPVHELGVDDVGEPYFTMRIVRGRTLAQVFDGRVAENAARVAELLLRVCETMAYAHHKGVIHRDLKPSNVMVGRYGEVVVMDWGLARVTTRDDTRDLHVAPPSASAALRPSLRSPDSSLYTMDGDVVGTPAYMSPEQADGSLGDLGPATDVYAVGAMLYHALAGHPPYLDHDERVPARTIWRRVQAGPPKPLAGEAPRAPAPLVALCERAMARLPGQRLESMQAFAAELRAFLEGRVVASYQTGPLAEAGAWCRRNRGVAIALVAVLVVLVGSGFMVADAERTSLQAERHERLVAEIELAATRAEELLAEADALWPVHPQRVPAMNAWRDEVDALWRAWPEAVDAPLPPLSVGSAMSPLAESQPFAPNSSGAQALAAEHARLLSLIDELRAVVEPEDPVRHADDLAVLGDRLDVVEAVMPGSTESVPTDGSSMPAAAARDEPVAWREHEARQRLRAALAALARPGGACELVASRRGLALRLGDDDPERALAWREARASIADREACPLYDGLAVTAQLGLWPLRRNPATSLWEFWVEASGARPELGPDGHWIVDAQAGVVLVLIPGGDTLLGAQATDPEAPRFDSDARMSDGPPRLVRLSAYFLAAHELTQAQWARLTGHWPATATPGQILEAGPPFDPPGRVRPENPVESVTWDEADDALARIRLVLPGEAQWEHGARAGHEGPRAWAPDGDVAAHLTALNIGLEFMVLEQYGAGPLPEGVRAPTDGWAAHAPVGSYAPNAFGLHDTAGNVREWCRDWFAADLSDAEVLGVEHGPGDLSDDQPSLRSVRGGAFRDIPEAVRSGARFGERYDARRDDLGLRAARPLQP